MLEVAKQGCVKPARVRLATIKHFTQKARLAHEIHAVFAFQRLHPFRYGAAFLHWSKFNAHGFGALVLFRLVGTSAKRVNSESE